MKKILQKAINTIGYEAHKYPGEELRRRKNTFQHYRINKVFDVGANLGQYGKELRAVGFRGEIHSFEPMSDVFQKLSKNAARDSNWKVYNHAMGSQAGTSMINVAGNSFSSSIKEMLPSHENAAPESAFVSQMEIQIRTVDELFPQIVQQGDRPYLKVDTQGYESEVLKGASASLDKFVGVQLEMSMVQLYQDERLFDEMHAYMNDKGFRLHSLEPGLDDPKTGRLLQLDGVFINSREDK